MKKYIILPLLVSLLFTGALSARVKTFVHYPKSLAMAVTKIEQLPEASNLLDQVRRDGMISLQFGRCDGFGALWDPNRRMISVNGNQKGGLGEYIASILFELHNAKSCHEFDRLFVKAERGEIDIERYVESVERIEYRNLCETASLVERGVRTGVFPRNTPVADVVNFDNHYKIQQLSGHSQLIASNFNHICPKRSRKPYRGTLGRYANLSQSQKEQMMQRLCS